MRGRTKELWDLWYHFNDKYFGGKLIPPKVIRITRAKKYWGAMVWRGTANEPLYHLAGEARLHIAGMLRQYDRIGTLLHEMVHQYQYQILRTPPDHDVIFRTYCKWIERETGFDLR